MFLYFGKEKYSWIINQYILQRLYLNILHKKEVIKMTQRNLTILLIDEKDGNVLHKPCQNPNLSNLYADKIFAHIPNRHDIK